jgi:hypothetical protein
MDRFVGSGQIFYAFLWNTDVLAQAGYAIPNLDAGDCKVVIDTGTLGDGESTLSGAAGDALVNDPVGRSPTNVGGQKISVEASDVYPRWDIITVNESGVMNAHTGVAAPAQVGDKNVSVPEERGRLQVDTPSPDSMRMWNPYETPLALLWVPGSKSSVTSADLFDVRSDPYYLHPNAVTAIETLSQAKSRALALGPDGITIDGTRPLLDANGSVEQSNLGFDTATQTELDTGLSGKADTSHGHPLSDLGKSGASSGQVAKYDGTSWAPAADENTQLDPSTIGPTDLGFDTATQTELDNLSAADVGALADAAGSVAESNLAFDPVTESETDRDSVEDLIETMPQGLDPVSLPTGDSVEELVFCDGTQTLELWAWRCSETPSAGGNTPSGLKLQVIDGSNAVVYQAGGSGNGGGVRAETGDPTATTLRNGALHTAAPGSAATLALRLQNDTSTDYSSSTGGVGAGFAYRVVET